MLREKTDVDDILDNCFFTDLPHKAPIAETKTHDNAAAHLATTLPTPATKQPISDQSLTDTSSDSVSSSESDSSTESDSDSESDTVDEGKQCQYCFQFHFWSFESM